MKAGRQNWIRLSEAAEILDKPVLFIRRAAKHGIVRIAEIHPALWGTSKPVPCVREHALEDLDCWDGGERVNSVRELIRAGYGDAVIAARTGIKERSVARARQRMGGL